MSSPFANSQAKVTCAGVAPASAATACGSRSGRIGRSSGWCPSGSPYRAHHIEHLTGLAKSTLADYRSYAKNDINPVLGPMPLIALSSDDIAKWTQALADAGQSGKTVSDKHRCLSSALNGAVKVGYIPYRDTRATRGVGAGSCASGATA
jgi:hypothetical protein